VRRRAHGGDPDGAEAAGLRCRSLQGAHLRKLRPLPSVNCVLAGGLTEHVEGRIFWDPQLPEVPRGQRAAHCEAMVGALAELPRADWRAVGLADFGIPGDYLRRQSRAGANSMLRIPRPDAYRRWTG
jgi:hypothetical protein